MYSKLKILNLVISLLDVIMKLFLIAIIGVLLWQSTDARQFTADTLQHASEIIEPNENKKLTIGETIDSFLN